MGISAASLLQSHHVMDLYYVDVFYVFLDLVEVLELYGDRGEVAEVMWRS